MAAASLRILTFGRLGPLLVVLAALAVAAFAAFGPAPAAVAIDTGGAPHLTVKGSGDELLSGAAIAPGFRTARTVTVSNTGDSAADLSLELPVGDGRGSGLARALRIQVADARTGAVLARAPLATFGAQRLLRLGAGGHRRLRLSASVPRDTRIDFAGDSAATRVSWTLVQA
jgi:hypothetical protein